MASVRAFFWFQFAYDTYLGTAATQQRFVGLYYFWNGVIQTLSNLAMNLLFSLGLSNHIFLGAFFAILAASVAYSLFFGLRRAEDLRMAGIGYC